MPYTQELRVSQEGNWLPKPETLKKFSFDMEKGRFQGGCGKHRHHCLKQSERIDESK